MIGPFENEKEQQNCFDYMHTNFFKFLLFYGKGTINVTKSVFSLIPLLNLSKSWTDKELYKKYELNNREIEFIDSIIKPIEFDNE